VPAPRTEVRVVEDAAALADAAAEEFVAAAGDAVRARGFAAVALSGGSTPRRLYALLAESPRRERIDWGRLHVFFGDERPVPPDDPDSNYRMAREAMLSKVPVLQENVERFRGEEDPERAASLYQESLRRRFRLEPGEIPRFDLALLGLGPDGHTASLFPGTRAVRERDRLAVANWVGRLDAVRLTLTAPVFNRADRVLFLVGGEDKAKALKSVLEGPFEPEQLPAQLIRPDPGRVLWIVDRAAASRLAPETVGKTS
jgi:6-phosphogluconolactonase